MHRLFKLPDAFSLHAGYAGSFPAVGFQHLTCMHFELISDETSHQTHLADLPVVGS